MGRGQKKNDRKVAEETGYSYRKNKTDERNARKDFYKKKARDRAMAADEEFQFAKQLTAMDLRIKYITGDGNCLFRSIGDQVEGDPTKHRFYRDRIVDYILDNRDFFCNFIEDDEDFDCYIARMRTDCEWGGHQELYATSQLLQSDIIVHQFQSPRFIIRAATQPCARTIHLSYHGEMHYNSVRNKTDSDSQIPSIIVLPSSPASSLPLSDDDMYNILRSIPGAKMNHLNFAVNHLTQQGLVVNAWNVIDVLIEHEDDMDAIIDSLSLNQAAVVVANNDDDDDDDEDGKKIKDNDDSNTRAQHKPKRKELCSCGSGKQYFQCCRSDNNQIKSTKVVEPEPRQRRKPRHKNAAEEKQTPTEIEV